MKRFCIQTAAAVLAAAAGFSLGLWQQAAGRSGGLWNMGSAPVVALLLVSLLAVAGAVWLSRAVPKMPRALPRGGIWYVADVVSGVLLTAAAALTFPGYTRLDLVCSLLGILGGIITTLRGLQRYRGRQPDLLLGCVIVLWLLLQIIGDFRVWSTDPLILDYCYPLFALLCSMAACYHSAGWMAGLGKGRLTAFWCAAGLYFCAVALSMCSDSQLLLYLALGILNGQTLACVLRAEAAE